MNKAFFIASTGQNVGKTTTCLGLLAGLRRRFNRVGFMKPIGQEHVKTSEGSVVDKDVALFKEVFDLSDRYEAMSPVLFPSGFTRDYLDGKIDEKELSRRILASYEEIAAANDCVVVEGTGHVGVGSIVNLNNAKVAKMLGTDLVMIGSGGLGSSFDALALNKTLCDLEGVHLAGVILNRVLPDKRDMVIDYFSKALKRWDIPLLGCIPYDSFLSSPTMNDYATLFGVEFLSGAESRLRHFKRMRLVATSVDVYRDLIVPSQLVITPASREDIILATLSKHWDMKVQNPGSDLESGLILTGMHPPRKSIIQDLINANLPAFYAPIASLEAMQMINSYTAKIRKEDTAKVNEAIHVVEGHIDFQALCKAVSLPSTP